MSEENTNTNDEHIEDVSADAVVENNDQPTVDELMSKLAKLESDLKSAREEAKKNRKEKTAVKTDLEKQNETIETVRTQLQAELEEANSRYNQLLERQKSSVVDSKVKAALDEAKCLSHRTMTREVLDRIESTFDIETGEVKLVVKNPDGTPMFIKGKDATLADLVKSLREDPELAHAFEGVQEGGTGAKAPHDLKTKDAVENPWKTGNTALQHKMWKENETLARKLRDEVRGKPVSPFAHR